MQFEFVIKFRRFRVLALKERRREFLLAVKLSRDEF